MLLFSPVARRLYLDQAKNSTRTREKRGLVVDGKTLIYILDKRANLQVGVLPGLNFGGWQDAYLHFGQAGEFTGKNSTRIELWWTARRLFTFWTSVPIYRYLWLYPTYNSNNNKKAIVKPLGIICLTPGVYFAVPDLLSTSDPDLAFSVIKHVIPFWL